MIHLHEKPSPIVLLFYENAIMVVHCISTGRASEDACSQFFMLYTILLEGPPMSTGRAPLTVIEFRNSYLRR